MTFIHSTFKILYFYFGDEAIDEFLILHHAICDQFCVHDLNIKMHLILNVMVFISVTRNRMPSFEFFPLLTSYYFVLM